MLADLSGRHQHRRDDVEEASTTRSNRATDRQLGRQALLRRHHGHAFQPRRRQPLARLVFGSTLQGGVTRAVRKLSGNRLPLWNHYMPSAGAMPKAGNERRTRPPACGLFPSCASRTMGPGKGRSRIGCLAGEDCCSAAQGRLRGGSARGQRFIVLRPALRKVKACRNRPTPNDGKSSKPCQGQSQRTTPIVFDTTPPALCGSRKIRHKPRSNWYDITEFLHDVVLARLTIHKRQETVAIHPTCSNINMGLQAKAQSHRRSLRGKSHRSRPDFLLRLGW